MTVSSLAEIIQEGIATKLDRMTNDQFPLTERGASATRAATPAEFASRFRE
jgi:hypothetical protein